MKCACVAFSAAFLTLASDSASAWELRVRFVERVGTVEMVLTNNEIWYGSGLRRRVRLQMGVFDDAAGPAPEGGLYGMENVSLTSVALSNRRTPGRLPAFSYPPEGNGEPATDPFHYLTNIDAVIGQQTLTWECSGGTPLPQPTPTIRGRNTFVSVWETTIEPEWICLYEARLTFTGHALYAANWPVQNTPIEPVCPSTPGQVTYAAAVPEGVAFTAELRMIVGGGPPICAGDWNQDQTIDSRDFFDFITDFFNGYADANCDAMSNSADFFWFLEMFFSNCGL